MTENTALAVPDSGPEPGTTDPAVMRHRAGQLQLEAYIAHQRANQAYREADQLEHEADLWENADKAEDAATVLHERHAPLEASETASVVAVREAEDHLRTARGRLTRARNDEARADASGNLQASEDAAARTAKAERNVARAEAALTAKRGELAAAEKALADHNLEISGAAARCREAYAAAMNPARAPRRHPILVPVGNPGGMTESERRNLAAMLGLQTVVHVGDGSPRQPSQETGGLNWRSDLARMDPGKARVIRGQNTVIIPAVPGR